MNKEAFINGFVKRAESRKVSKEEALELLKKQDNDKKNFTAIGLGNYLLGKGIEMAAQRGMKADKKSDRINQKELENWARKYLKSENVYVAPRTGYNNAHYGSFEQNGEKVHVIEYDPRFNKSVGAHEIGHGMGRIPRIPLSKYFGPFLSGVGAYQLGSTGGESGLLPLAIGVGAQLPTLADEWMASHRAKKILRENNIEPKGLTRAWLTYASPLIGAAIAGGAGYFGRD